MEPQMLINFGLGVVLSGLGWFARQIWDALAKLRADLRQLEIDLPSHYLRRDEFSNGMKEIKEMLIRISDKLDMKADK